MKEMEAFAGLVGIVTLLSMGLACPAGLLRKSWRAFFVGSLKVAVFIVVPLGVFVLSVLLTPEWKGGCEYGWLDCFHTGKLALTPLVLYALAAFYAIDVLQVRNRTHWWIVSGMWLGAILGLGFLAFFFVTAGMPSLRWNQGLWIEWIVLLVLLYVTAWFLARAVQLSRERPRGIAFYVATVFTSLPFWLASAVWSVRIYSSLPEEPPDCFIATAALRGHASLVGPFSTIVRGGRVRQANKQLLTFWALEDLWHGALPRSHQAFRMVYNVLGYQAAKAICHRLTADGVYLLLKPLEVVACITLRVIGGEPSGSIRSEGQSASDHELRGNLAIFRGRRA
jgi:hypothetical protein